MNIEKPHVSMRHGLSRLGVPRRQANTSNLRNRDRIRSGATGLTTSKSPVTLAAWCGISVVLIYFIRGTVLPFYVHVPDSIWVMLAVVSLFIACVTVISDGGSWRWEWVMVLVAFAASLTQAEQFGTAASRWVGLALLMLAVGPMVRNPVAIQIRSAAWTLVVNGITALTAIFIFWYVLHLPSPGGRSPFAGFMNQSMILGPIAGLGVVIAAARAIHGNSWRWGLLAVFSLIPLVASGSRVAILAAGCAGCYLLFRRKPMLGGVMALLFLFAIGYFVTRGASTTEGDSVGGALSRKGTANSRADLWASRIAEFESSPVLGIGIAMGTGSGSAIEADGSIRVEPGSSYLAILAMTGGVGTIAFFSALGLCLFRFAAVQSKPPLETDILSLAGVFLAVHGVAEGWILGFGSPLCFLFWLWLGNVGDVAWQPVRPVASRGLRRLARTRLLGHAAPNQ